MIKKFAYKSLQYFSAQPNLIRAVILAITILASLLLPEIVFAGPGGGGIGGS
jgi:hypothetical protein